MARKRKKTNSGSGKLIIQTQKIIGKVWAPITGLIGAILLLNQIVEIWSGNPSRINYILLGILAFVWFVVLVILTFGKSLLVRRGFFSKKIFMFRKSISLYRLISGFTLLVTVVGTVFGVVFFQYRMTETSRFQDDKVIVLIATFDDGDETKFDPYGIQNALITKLNDSVSGYDDVEIITVSEIVTVNQGSTHARKLGRKYKADIVIWGWYRPVENPVNIYVENLSSPLFSVIDPSQIYTPTATTDELRQVEYRQKIGGDISALVDFVTGLIRYQKGDFKLAIQAFENALLNSDNSETLISQDSVYLSIANAYAEMTNHQSAIDNYTKAIEINPSYVSAYNNRAKEYVNNNQPELALADYTKAIETDPQYPLAYSNRGALYNALHKYDLAIQDLTIGIKINPNPAGAYNNRGFSYYNLGQFDKAIADYTRAIEVNPQLATPYHNRGQLYNTLQEYDKAILDFTQAIAVFPQYARAYNDRGVSNIMLNKYDQAFSDFDQAIFICSQNIECGADLAFVYLSRGNLFMILGQQSEALSDFTQAIIIDPKSVDSYNSRAKIYIQQKEYDKALADLNVLIELNPNYAPAYYDRGTVYNALNRQEEANADFMKFQELNEGISP